MGVGCELLRKKSSMFEPTCRYELGCLAFTGRSCTGFALVWERVTVLALGVCLFLLLFLMLLNRAKRPLFSEAEYTTQYLNPHTYTNYLTKNKK